jgi:predicted amidophosphoribosyltransferase
MKELCWSCSEPRDTLKEFCSQCGAGERPIPKPVIVKPAVKEPEPEVKVSKPVKSFK